MQYIIFLRGINVGGRNIKMVELKSCFEKNGYSNVQTVLQTGNVIVDTKEKDAGLLSQKIASILEKSFHYPAKVMAITPKKLSAVVDKNPFAEVDKDFHRYILFTKNGFENTLAGEFEKTENNDERICKGDGVIYWQVRRGLTLDSPFAKIIAKTASKEFQTTRNVNTLEKILLKCGV